MNLRLLIFLMITCFTTPFAQGQHYPKLSNDIAFKNGYNGSLKVNRLETAFNHGRDEEDKQLSTDLPEINFPDSTTWKAKGPEERALWIINKERKARGLKPFSGLDSSVTGIADDYAIYLGNNDTFGHFADGRSPTDRLKTHPDINGCMDYHWENLFWTGAKHSATFENFTGFAIYNFIYHNSSSNWAHRSELFHKNYKDNSGNAGEEGLLGVGYEEVQNYTRYGTTYQDASILVLNGIDPCASFPYNSETGTAVNPKAPALNLFPVPAKKHVYIETNAKLQAITIYNVNGEQVKQLAPAQEVIQVSDMPAGIYQIHLRTMDDGSFTQKFIVH